MNLVVSKKFDTDLKKLLKKNSRLKEKVGKTLILLQEKPDHPSLRLHKLIGLNNYSVSVDMSLRIICHFDKQQIFLLRIGNHDKVY